MPHRSVQAMRHRVQAAQHHHHIVGYRVRVVERATQRVTDHIGRAGAAHNLLAVLFAPDREECVSHVRYNGPIAFSLLCRDTRRQRIIAMSHGFSLT